MVKKDPFETLLTRIAEGVSLRALCKKRGMPSRSSVYERLNVDSDFADRYARACAIRADVVFDEVLEIADNPKLPADHRRLQVDARKWALGKMMPKKYGDRLELDGAVTHSITVQDNFKDET